MTTRTPASLADARARRTGHPAGSQRAAHRTDMQKPQPVVDLDQYRTEREAVLDADDTTAERLATAGARATRGWMVSGALIALGILSAGWLAGPGQVPPLLLMLSGALMLAGIVTFAVVGARYHRAAGDRD